MLDYRYAYLIGDLILGLVWLIFFLLRKDLRKELLLVSFVAGFIGPFAQLYYTLDYWNPITIMGTKIGVEDFLFAFFCSGVAGTCHSVFFNKRYKVLKTLKKGWFMHLVTLLVVILGIGIWVFIETGLNTIYVSYLIFGLGTLYIGFRRRDLLPNIFWSGLLTGLLVIPLWSFFILIFPNIFEMWWQLENLSGITINTIPIEEPLWALFAGMTFGPAYEFLMDLKYTS